MTMNADYGARFSAARSYESRGLTGLRATDVIRRAGCTYRQFGYWRRGGMFGPTAQGLGSGGWNDGRFNIYTDDDVLAAMVAVAIYRSFGRVHVAALCHVTDAVRDGESEIALFDMRLVIDVNGLRSRVSPNDGSRS